MRRLIEVLTFALTVAGVAACSRADNDASRDEEPLPVIVSPVVATDTAERLEAGGVVSAQLSASISSRIVATIADVRVRPGDRVRAGDVLVALDARDVTEQTGLARARALAAEMALTQAAAERDAIEAEHRLATAWNTRIAALHAKDSATDQERDEAQARLSSATARLEAARARIEGAKAELESGRAAVGVAAATEAFATLRAPFDGLVTERLADAGSLAAPGVPLVRMESGGARQVVVRVDEARAARIQPGDRVSVEIDALDDAVARDKQVGGVVAEVARAAGADQHAFTVKVTVPAAVAMRTGSFARVVFRGEPRRALLVPAEAIRRHGQVSSVYVVQDGVARLRLIQAGRSSPEGVEVLAGLDSGESVVTPPPAGLADGRKVVIRGRSAGTRGAL